MIPDSVFRLIFEFASDPKGLGYTNRVNGCLYTDEMNKRRQKVDEVKSLGKSLVTLKEYYNQPPMWNVLDESMENIFFEGIRNNLFIERLYNDKYIMIALLMASERYHTKLVVYLLKLWHPRACDDTRTNPDDKYTYSDNYMFDQLFTYAAQSNDEYLIDILIDKQHFTLRSYPQSPGTIKRVASSRWNSILTGAAKGGHIDLINSMLGMDEIEIELGLEGAMEGGKEDVIDYVSILVPYSIMHSTIQDPELLKNSMVMQILKSGNMNLIRKYIKHADSFLIQYCQNIESVEYLISIGHIDFEYGLAHAILYDTILIDYFYGKFISTNPRLENCDRIFRVCSKMGNTQIIRKLVEYFNGKIDVAFLASIIVRSISNGHIYTVKYLVSIHSYTTDRLLSFIRKSNDAGIPQLVKYFTELLNKLTVS
jgi:hypothetical protein